MLRFEEGEPGDFRVEGIAHRFLNRIKQFTKIEKFVLAVNGVKMVFELGLEAVFFREEFLSPLFNAVLLEIPHAEVDEVRLQEFKICFE